jgi:PAS domain-containing protein
MGNDCCAPKDVVVQTNPRTALKEKEEKFAKAKKIDKVKLSGTINQKGKNNKYQKDDDVNELTRIPIKEKTLTDLLSSSHDHSVVVISSTWPYHIEYANNKWSNACGWSSEEVQGLDFKFLQGYATDLVDVRKKVTEIQKHGGYGQPMFLNYNKNDMLLQNFQTTFPLPVGFPGGNEGIDGKDEIEHVAVILQKSIEVKLPKELVDKSAHGITDEIGMPIDRREKCNSYPDLNAYPPPMVEEWDLIAKHMNVSHALRYMLAVQAPMAITDIHGNILHLNIPWTKATNVSAYASEGRNLTDFMDEDETSLSAQLSIRNYFGVFNSLCANDMNHAEKAVSVTDKDESMLNLGMDFTSQSEKCIHSEGTLYKNESEGKMTVVTSVDDDSMESGSVKDLSPRDGIDTNTDATRVLQDTLISNFQEEVFLRTSYPEWSHAIPQRDSTATIEPPGKCRSISKMRSSWSMSRMSSPGPPEKYLMYGSQLGAKHHLVILLKAISDPECAPEI